MIKIGIFISALIYLAHSQIGPYCPKNEEIKTCVKPKWCNTCAIKGNCKLLADNCKKGCDCKEGYYRNKRGECISEKECTKSQEPCKDYEIFNSCGSGCVKSCKNLPIKIACAAVCIEGCFCPYGLVRADNNSCIQAENCPSDVCPENEEPTSCTSRCETCDNPGINCETFACEPGCKCKDGYYRNSEGRCIPQNECVFGAVLGNRQENVCPPNEELVPCAQPPGCMTCESPYRCFTFVCTGEGCDCIEGYYRSSNGSCIHGDQCSNPKNSCGPNEKYYTCTPSCKNTCETFANPAIRCGCGPPGCFCKEGLVKRKDGLCVKYEECKSLILS